jgi:hypothetical protein
MDDDHEPPVCTHTGAATTAMRKAFPSLDRDPLWGIHYLYIYIRIDGITMPRKAGQLITKPVPEVQAFVSLQSDRAPMLSDLPKAARPQPETFVFYVAPQ